MKATSRPRLVAYVGCYSTPANASSGGISILELDPIGRPLNARKAANTPCEAGYLAYSRAKQVLYAVDERKTDGRGPVEPAASVHALRVEQSSGDLTWLNSQLAPGPRPTHLSLGPASDVLLSANHGDFQHVERVIRDPAGGWGVEYVYDDSTVISYALEADGRVGRIRDLVVLSGHGMDPNESPQNGGHAQASAHAHCAVVDPSGRYVVVCDKGTDRVLVYRMGEQLAPVFVLTLPPQAGPRHIEFDAPSGLAYMTCEFASELATLRFDFETGHAEVIARVSTVTAGFVGLNEPAEVRVHPSGRFVYVNNRGEDSLAWFTVLPDGQARRTGHVRLAKSVHPGLAARSFSIDPTGTFMLVADRPANLVRSFRVDPQDGSLDPIGEIAISHPAFVAFVELE
jgi:6-phosphogluconolactonase